MSLTQCLHYTDPVLDFLSGLKPNMSSLLPTFKHAGISDKETFRAVIELPDRDRDELVDDLRLNLLQARIIKRSLKALVNAK